MTEQEQNLPAASSGAPLGGSLLDLVLLCVKRWRTVAGWTLGATLVMLVVSLLLPKWYKAEVRLLAPKQRGFQGLMIPGMAAGAASAFDLLGLLGGSTEPNLLANILQSRTVTDAVITRFDLQKRYKKKTIEETRKEFWSHASVDIERKSGVLTASVEDTSPQLARDMANTLAEEASKLANRLSNVRAGQERRFLEGRLTEQRQDLVKAEVALKEFSVKHKVLDLQEQAKASIHAVARIQGEIMARDVMMSYLTSYAGEGDATKERLAREIAALRRQLAVLEEGSPLARKAGGKSAPAGASVVTPVTELPELALEYARLLRELKIQETLFELLTRQYELAKIAEAADTSVAQIIDSAVLPTYKARPKRVFFVVFGFLAGLVLGIAVARFQERVAADPNTALRWRTLCRAFHFGRGSA